MKKRILIVYAPYGSGHQSIATKIYDYFEEFGDYEIKLFDVAKYSNFLGKVSIKLFDMVIKHSFHKTFSFIYDIKIMILTVLAVIKKY